LDGIAQVAPPQLKVLTFNSPFYPKGLTGFWGDEPKQYSGSDEYYFQLLLSNNPSYFNDSVSSYEHSVSG
jgi:hypothetical protein